MWPGFDSRTRHHMMLLLLVLVLAPRGFSPGTYSRPVFPSPQKNNISKFMQLTLKSPERDEPILKISIYLFKYSTEEIKTHQTYHPWQLRIRLTTSEYCAERESHHHRYFPSWEAFHLLSFPFKVPLRSNF